MTDLNQVALKDKAQQLIPSNYQIDSVEKITAYKVVMSKTTKKDGSPVDEFVSRYVVVDDINNLQHFEL